MKTRANYLKVGIPEVTGFFINTDEKKDIYEVPWDNAEGRFALLRLREWQERHDVISRDHIFAELDEAGK